jgi:uncharacterized membrane protein YdjX (TVP38/TMEM64 family)
LACPHAPHPPTPTPTDAAALAFAALLAVAGVAVSLGWLDPYWVEAVQDDTLDAVQDDDDLGAALLGAALAVSTALAVPPSLLAFVAGALFGFARGMALSWAGSLVGETAAFLAGRHLLRARVERLLRAWPAWGHLSAQLRDDGWLLVLLLRLSPATPFSLLNFALGSTQLPLGQYLWPSAVGVVPGLALAVWGGAVVRAASDRGKDAPQAPLCECRLSTRPGLGLGFGFGLGWAGWSLGLAWFEFFAARLFGTAPARGAGVGVGCNGRRACSGLGRCCHPELVGGRVLNLHGLPLWPPSPRAGQRIAWAALCAVIVIATSWGVAVYAKRAIARRLEPRPAAGGGAGHEAGPRAAAANGHVNSIAVRARARALPRMRGWEACAGREGQGGGERAGCVATPMRRHRHRPGPHAARRRRRPQGRAAAWYALQHQKLLGLGPGRQRHGHGGELQRSYTAPPLGSQLGHPAD